MIKLNFLLLLLFTHSAYSQTSEKKISMESVTSLRIQSVEELTKLKETNSFTNLKELDIDIGGEIEVQIPNEIFELNNLENLNVHAFGVAKKIFPNLYKLESLKYLWIEDNSENIQIDCKKLNLQHLTLVLNNCEHLNSNIEEAYELIKLDINSDKIKKIHFDFSVFKNLKNLRIWCQNLEEFPVSIGAVKNLSEIDFYVKTDITLPVSFSKLTELKKIRYGQCRRFPQVILELVSLEYLSFDRNYFTEIPNEISNLVNLKELELSFYQGKTLCEGVGKLPKLEYLSVSYSNLEYLPFDLSGLNSIEGIDLGSNTNMKDKKSLLKSLETCKKLRFIALSSTGFTPIEQEEIKNFIAIEH